MTSEMAVDYVKHRAGLGGRDECGSREAARRAGYSSGAPSETARMMWEAYKYVADATAGQLVARFQRRQKYQDDIARFELQIERRKSKLKRLDCIEKAMKIHPKTSR